MNQGLLWQEGKQSPHFAELCHALYERELRRLSESEVNSVTALQARLKSLPHYIKRTAESMLQVQSPLTLDVQNASWSSKQGTHLPLTGQDAEQVWHWYRQSALPLGLVIPVCDGSHVFLDSIDRVDEANQRFRSNACGWFSSDNLLQQQTQGRQLLKPSKKVMIAACAGHSWLADRKTAPVMPTLRELLLSCQINWQNFRRLASS